MVEKRCFQTELRPKVYNMLGVNQMISYKPLPPVSSHQVFCGTALSDQQWSLEGAACSNDCFIHRQQSCNYFQIAKRPKLRVNPRLNTREHRGVWSWVCDVFEEAASSLKAVRSSWFPSEGGSTIIHHLPQWVHFLIYNFFSHSIFLFLSLFLVLVVLIVFLGLSKTWFSFISFNNKCFASSF